MVYRYRMITAQGARRIRMCRLPYIDEATARHSSFSTAHSSQLLLHGRLLHQFALQPVIFELVALAASRRPLLEQLARRIVVAHLVGAITGWHTR